MVAGVAQPIRSEEFIRDTESIVLNKISYCMVVYDMHSLPLCAYV